MNILLIDDHDLFREGVKLLLTGLTEKLAFTEAADCETALALGDTCRFDIVLLDFHMPGLHGLPALQALRAKFEDAVIVVLSGEDQPALIRQVIEQGAAGFIPKGSTHAVLLAALRLILAGGTYLPPHALAGQSHTSPDVNSGGTLKGLTQRQLETLKLAIQGKANKVIARDMGISEATVKAHLALCFRVLGVSNRTEAVFAATKAGLTI